MPKDSYAKIVLAPNKQAFNKLQNYMKQRAETPKQTKFRQFTKSDRFKTMSALFGILLGIYLVAAFVLFASHASSPASVCVKTDADSTPHSRLHTSFDGTTCLLRLERADTPEAREKGLSGKNNMSGAQGMLFVFDSTGTQCMWMKDMHFAIDILWLDSKGTILKVEKNVKPETYPKTFCGDNARMVVEVRAGVSDFEWLQVGQRI